MASKSVATAAESSTALTLASGFEAFAGHGMENVKASDLLIPRLTILQDLSPQLKKTKAEFIEGAEVGSICDVGTGEIFPEGVLFLPVFYRKDYLEWAPRSSGKGLVAVHPDEKILEQTTRNDKKQPILSNGNYVAETAQWFGLNLSAGRRKCFIPMTSTQLKKSRKWMTLATSERLKRNDGSEFTAPLFYRSYKLTTGAESNGEGEWAGWNITRALTLPEVCEAMGFEFAAVMQEAAKFREDLAAGVAKADNSEGEAAPGNEGAM